MIVLLLFMIICYCNKINFSSSINEVIRLVLFFFTIRFHKYKKVLKGTKKHFYHKTFFVNKQISYFFPFRCFLNLINLMSISFKLINFMSINFKLINFLLTKFVNNEISYFFSLRCFLD